MKLVEAPAAGLKFLVWLIITSQVMVLHYRLFKRGIFYNHTSTPEREASRVGCFEFCRDISANPAAKLLTGLAAMLLEPDTTGRPYLKLLHSKFGPASSEWPIDVITCLHISAMMAFCRGWRLLFHFFVSIHGLSPSVLIHFFQQRLAGPTWRSFLTLQRVLNH